MKSLIISIIIAAFFSRDSPASYNKHNSPQIMMNTVNQSLLPQLLSLYYDVKNALLGSDPNTASAKANEFAKSINQIDMKDISESDMNIFMTYQKKLAEDATLIASAKDIKHQREHFNSFSTNMYAFTKALKFNNQPVYYDYCPMQKAHWLSSESSIKNPYFGTAMLTCGKVEETLK